MANDWTKVVPKLLAQGLLALRQQTVMPRLVNRAYETLAGQKGSTIDVPIPSSVTVQDVSPSNTAPTTTDQTPTSVAIALDQWKEAPFYLTDKELMEVMEGTIPMQASEAIKAIANEVDKHILGKYKGIYGFAGVAGTTPFATDLTEYVNARKELANQLAPFDDRRVVIDADAEAKALLLRAFQDAGFGGGAGVIQNGQIGRKLGADWWMDQNIPKHSNTGGTGFLVNETTVAIGDKEVTVDTGTTAPAAGDIFTVAGDTQTYVCVGAQTTTLFKFEPAAKVAWSDNSAIAFKATHIVNLLFHRDAFAFATRPLESAVQGLGNLIQAAIDPVSGLTLRLEVSREHKRTRFSYDILYGAALVRRELAARIAG